MVTWFPGPTRVTSSQFPRPLDQGAAKPGCADGLLGLPRLLLLLTGWSLCSSPWGQAFCHWLQLLPQADLLPLSPLPQSILSGLMGRGIGYLPKGQRVRQTREQGTVCCTCRWDLVQHGFQCLRERTIGVSQTTWESGFWKQAEILESQVQTG